MDKKTKILVVGFGGVAAALVAVLMTKADDADVVLVASHEEEELSHLGGLDPFIIEPNDIFEDSLVSPQGVGRSRAGPAPVPRRSRAGRLFLPDFINPLRPERKPGVV